MTAIISASVQIACTSLTNIARVSIQPKIKEHQTKMNRWTPEKLRGSLETRKNPALPDLHDFS